jgi:hypothetical protein
MNLKTNTSRITVSAASLGGIAFTVNDQREQVIIRRCEAVQHSNEIGQLKARNGFLRKELGCLLPAGGSTLDRSCLDKKVSERVCQS